MVTDSPATIAGLKNLVSADSVPGTFSSRFSAEFKILDSRLYIAQTPDLVNGLSQSVLAWSTLRRLPSMIPHR